MRVRDCQSTADLTSTCPQREVKDHPASLGVTCGQLVELPAVFLFSRSILPLQISSYPNSWVGTDLIHWPKSPPTGDRTRVASHSTNSKQYA